MARKGLISRVKREFDWESYVRDNYTVKSTSSAELRIDCIRCTDNKKKLYVNPDKGVFFCQRCNFNSKNFDLFDFVAETEGIPRGKAMARLIREYAQTTPEDEEFEDQIHTAIANPEAAQSLQSIKTLEAMPDGLLKLEGRTEQSERFWQYLCRRGLTEEEILAIRFHYTPAKTLPVYDSKDRYRGDLANRVVVPIYGGSNVLVSWQGRLIIPGDMKYMSAPESEMAKTVWPYVPPKDKHVVLVEGIYDCLAVRRAGFSAYASFTKKISLEQILRLRAWGAEEVTLFWDKRDAYREMTRAVKELNMHFKRVHVPRLKDWPSDLDAGNMLADSDGADKLKKALSDIVDTYDDLEFARWQLIAAEW